MSRHQNRCECGRAKVRHREACDACRFLDGARSGPREVISALRTIGSRLTVTEIASETGQSYINVTGILRRLVENGRVRRVAAEIQLAMAGFASRPSIHYELVLPPPRVKRAATRARRRRAAHV